jgi:hypothetical protein
VQPGSVSLLLVLMKLRKLDQSAAPRSVKVLAFCNDQSAPGELVNSVQRNRPPEMPPDLCQSFGCLQKLIPPTNSVLALILYSDGTPLSLSGRQKVRPVVLTLANIPKELRGKLSGWVLVGYIPYIKPRSELGLSENSEALRSRQLQIWHDSYTTILQRLKLHTLT